MSTNPQVLVGKSRDEKAPSLPGFGRSFYHGQRGFQQHLQQFLFFAGSSCQINPSALRLASARWPDWSQFTILIAVNTNVKYISTTWNEPKLCWRQGLKQNHAWHDIVWISLGSSDSGTFPWKLLACSLSSMKLSRFHCFWAWKRQAQRILMNTGNIYLCRLPSYQKFSRQVCSQLQLYNPRGQVIGVVRKPVDMVNNLHTSKCSLLNLC